MTEISQPPDQHSGRDMDRHYLLDDYKPADMSRVYAALWKRLLAFFIDALFIALIGFALIHLFFDYLVRLEGLGRLIGFGVALLYFGAMNSAFSGGQTFGKRMMKIVAVRTDGTYLTPLQSSIRYTVIGVPL